MLHFHLSQTVPSLCKALRFRRCFHTSETEIAAWARPSLVRMEAGVSGEQGTYMQGEGK